MKTPPRKASKVILSLGWRISDPDPNTNPLFSKRIGAMNIFLNLGSSSMIQRDTVTISFKKDADEDSLIILLDMGPYVEPLLKIGLIANPRTMNTQVAMARTSLITNSTLIPLAITSIVRQRACGSSR